MGLNFTGQKPQIYPHEFQWIDFEGLQTTKRIRPVEEEKNFTHFISTESHANASLLPHGTL